MKFVKTIMAAALLTTAISSTVMAANDDMTNVGADYGFTGPKKFTLNEARATALLDGAFNVDHQKAGLVGAPKAQTKGVKTFLHAVAAELEKDLKVAGPKGLVALLHDKGGDIEVEDAGGFNMMRPFGTGSAVQMKSDADLVERVSKAFFAKIAPAPAVVAHDATEDLIAEADGIGLAAEKDSVSSRTVKQLLDEVVAARAAKDNARIGAAIAHLKAARFDGGKDLATVVDNALDGHKPTQKYAGFLPHTEPKAKIVAFRKIVEDERADERAKAAPGATPKQKLAEKLMDALEAFLGYIPNAPAKVTNDAEMQQLADAIQADIASSMDKDSEIAVLKAQLHHFAPPPFDVRTFLQAQKDAGQIHDFNMGARKIIGGDGVAEFSFDDVAGWPGAGWSEVK